MKPDKLYLKPVGGLCNRMRAVDTAVTLAAQLKKQLVVFWGRDVYLNCKFSDLFKASEYFQVLEEKQFLGRKAFFPYLPGSKPTSSFRTGLYGLTKAAFNIKTEIWFEDFEEAVSSLNSCITPTTIRSMKEFETKSFSYLSPQLEALNSPGSSFICTAWKLNSSQNYAKHFVPIDALHEKIQDLTRDFCNTIGIHIRRTDHVFSIKYSKLGKFINAIDQELQQDSNTKFFIATDCHKTEKELSHRYPNNVITYPKCSYNRNSSAGIQDALVDLYCLSRTRKIFGSYYSSFSQVASEISGIDELTI